MHLKRLELQGFKSFAGRTDLELETGITAVVGPNGSGKSNLAEGLRWALGEQSARQLRGSRMEDVIFHGSDRRRPVGMGEVTLTFDNVDGGLPLDFAEVTLVRRVYRSGESEYLINRTPARLRDVQELLAHTGVGRDGYAIMEQHRVDELLRARPEDRRALFEEAVGITRHRLRKREALRKLEETTHNLTRVADVITELGLQLEPLRQEAATARTYLHYRDERARLEEALRARGLARLNRQWQALEERKAALVQERESRRKRLDELEHDREAGRRRREELDQALAARERAVGELVARLQELETGRQLACERRRHLAGEADRLAGELAEAERARGQRETRVAELEKAGAALGAEVARLAAERSRREAARAEAETRARSRQARLEELKTNVIDLLNRRGEARHAAARAEEAQGRARAALAEHDRREAALAAEERRLRDESEGLQASAAELARQAADRRRTLAGLQARLPELGQGLQEARERAAGQKEQLAAMAARLATLGDLEDAREGLPPGARALLERDCPGIIGPLAGFVDADAHHRRALAAALENHAGCLLVERDALPRLIAEIHDGRLGRAMLWPVPPPVTGDPPPPPGPALAPVVGGPGGAVIRRLLEGVLLAADLEEALGLAAAAGYKCSVVTLDGEVVHPGGGVSAGAGAEAGPLGRRAEIARLERRVAELEVSARAAEAEVIRLEQAMVAARAEEAAVRDELTRLEAAGAGLERQGLNLRERLGSRAEEAETLGLERERLTRELGAAMEAAPARLAEVAALEQRMGAQQEEMQRLEVSLREDRQAEEELGRHLAELRADLARAEQKETGAAQLLEEARQALAGLAADLDSRARRLAAAREQGAARETEAAELQAAAAGVAAELETQREQGRAGREEREGLGRAQAGQEAEIATLREEIDGWRERLHELEVRAARLEVEYGNLARGGPVGDGTDLGGLTEPQARERAAALRGLMEAMGTVNLGAVGECERLQERCGFLERERADLEEARRGLDRLLAEMDQVMAERFLEGFAAIRDAFATIFAGLFGGGRGELVLEDPDDPLETGVEIRAQPAGKRLQSLSLLSAGERALTAIALLFAILKVRPAPFCILDEIDAPLDDINVVKFARLLKQYADHTQFLVVTHNKATMEVADALYGVTMEEGGVSRLVSVKLGEAERVAGGGE